MEFVVEQFTYTSYNLESFIILNTLKMHRGNVILGLSKCLIIVVNLGSRKNLDSTIISHISLIS